MICSVIMTYTLILLNGASERHVAYLRETEWERFEHELMNDWQPHAERHYREAINLTAKHVDNFECPLERVQTINPGVNLYGIPQKLPVSDRKAQE